MELHLHPPYTLSRGGWPLYLHFSDQTSRKEMTVTFAIKFRYSRRPKTTTQLIPANERKSQTYTSLLRKNHQLWCGYRTVTGPIQQKPCAQFPSQWYLPVEYKRERRGTTTRRHYRNHRAEQSVARIHISSWVTNECSTSGSISLTNSSRLFLSSKGLRTQFATCARQSVRNTGLQPVFCLILAHQTLQLHFAFIMGHG
jgi:hypothetical protein